MDRLSERTGLSRTTIAQLERDQGTIASLERLLVVMAPKARRRAPERAYWGEEQKDDRDSRFTPPEFMAHIYEAFGPVDLDPCAHEASPVVASRYIRLSDNGNGLAEPWTGRRDRMLPGQDSRERMQHGQFSVDSLGAPCILMDHNFIDLSRFHLMHLICCEVYSAVICLSGGL